MNVSKEIFSLRKSKKYDEAEQLFNQHQSNEELDLLWMLRAISWVYYDQIKEALKSKDYSRVEELIQKILTNGISINDDEDMFANSFWKIIGYHFLDLTKEFKSTQIPHSLDAYFSMISSTLKPIKSQGFSIIINAAASVDEEWEGFLSFVKWVRFNHLRVEDFAPYFSNQIKKNLPSVAEKYFLACFKALKNHQNNDLLAELANAIEESINLKVKQKWLTYTLAKIYLLLDQDEKGLQLFKPFAMENIGKYWVWHTLGTFYTELNQEDSALHSICKALDLNPKRKFIGPVLLDLIDLLVKKGEFSWAKREILDFGAKKPNQITLYEKSEWFTEVKPISENEKQNNYDLYADKAEQELFDSSICEDGHIEWIDYKKGILGVRISEEKMGVYKSKSKSNHWKIGDSLSVYSNSNGGKTIITHIESSNKIISEEWMCQVRGEVSISPTNQFAFIIVPEFESNIYVPEYMLSELVEDQIIEVKAIKVWNKNKSLWSWKAIEILPISEN